MTGAVTTIGKGETSDIVDPLQTIVRDEHAWRDLWAAHAGRGGDAPDVDFTTRMVAAAFAGERPSAGYGIEILEARQEGSTLAIAVKEIRPPRGAVAAQVIVTPFHIVALPRYEGDVRFTDAPSRSDPLVASEPPRFREPFAPSAAPDASARATADTTPSSTGLEANFAAALAYLAGPFSGILILLVERANGFVRFHAWQSIIGLGGLGLLSVGTLVFSFLTLLLSPFAFTVTYWLSAVIAVVWVVAWAVCLVKAFTGQRWEMPVAGRYAERLATRRSA